MIRSDIEISGENWIVENMPTGLPLNLNELVDSARICGMDDPLSQTVPLEDWIEYDYLYRSRNPTNNQVGALVAEGDCLSSTFPVARAGSPYRLFPNPVRQQLHLATDAQTANREAELKLFDLHGRLLRAFGWPVGQPRLELPVLDLPKGSYLLRIEQADGRVYTHRWIMQ